MPVYNGGPLLRDAIESILAQAAGELELILINDASGDGSRALIDEFARRDPRVRAIHHEKNHGLAATLNEALAAARGRLVARMDQDDIALPERLGLQADFMDRHPDVAVVGSWVYNLGVTPAHDRLVRLPFTPEQIRDAKMILWKGHCSVHQMFQPQHIERWRAAHPRGSVISHPECGFEVCKASDFVGSTETIINTVAAAPPNTEWLVGTELNLVTRIAEEFKPQGKLIQFMAPTVCMCSTMARIDPQHLCWTLENLAAGRVVNRIEVPEPDATQARVALDRMLAVS